MIKIILTINDWLQKLSCVETEDLIKKLWCIGTYTQNSLQVKNLVAYFFEYATEPMISILGFIQVHTLTYTRISVKV